MADNSSDIDTGINLGLFGRTGNGKSSTGNSILGEKKFIPKSSTSSAVIYEVKAATNEIDGVPVTVVEGPGLGDTDNDVTDDGQSMIDLSETALSLIFYKLHALIVVLKYGSRFTNQEKEAVKMIKAIFGEDVIKNYGIIVMTHGDRFDGDMEDDGGTFDKWCDDQTGDIRALFDECDKRCVLFDNRSTDAEKVGKQRQQLLNLVSGIMQDRLPYSNEDYLKALPSRRSLIVRGKLPTLDSKTELIVSNITLQLNKLKEQQKVENIKDLQTFSDELKDHKRWLESEDEGTGQIKYLLVKISIVEMRIKTLMDKEIRIEALQKEKSSKRGDASVVEKSDGRKGKSDSFVSILFYGHWSLIQYVFCWILDNVPRHHTTLCSSIETLFNCYTSLWSLVLPNTVMEDERLVFVRNQIQTSAAPFRAHRNE